MDFSQDNEESIDNHDGNSFSPAIGLYSLATASFNKPFSNPKIFFCFIWAWILIFIVTIELQYRKHLPFNNGHDQYTLTIELKEKGLCFYSL